MILIVVYLLIPTSNHNCSLVWSFSCGLYIFWFLHQTTTGWLHKMKIFRCISFDSYIKPQLLCLVQVLLTVVYLLIPTSNHNLQVVILLLFLLYIFWFLHQTTTLRSCVSASRCCISFDSYIKPQLLERIKTNIEVVYLLIPTSNHNTLSHLFK